MGISNTSRIGLVALFSFLAIGCKPVKEPECIRLVDFREEITFVGFEREIKDSIRIEFKQDSSSLVLTGHFDLINSDSTMAYGQVFFLDTPLQLCCRDTISINIFDKEYLITDVRQRQVETIGSSKPYILEYKINGQLARSGSAQLAR